MPINASDLRFRFSGGFTLPYDNLSGAFSIAETITGTTSGATAIVDGDHDTDADSINDTLRISTIAGGPFQDDEVITGGTSGATADVNSASGETLNIDPNLSLGGRMGDITLDLQGQSPTYTGSPIPGVALVRCGGGVDGDFVGQGGSVGQLRYIDSANTLEVRWPNGGSFGAAVDITGDQNYYLVESSGNRWIEVAVVNANLPAGDQTTDWAALQLLNELFRNFTKDELVPETTLYRMIYIVNVHATDDFLKVEISKDRASSTVFVDEEYGLDPVTLGDGITTGIGTTIATEFVAPGGVSFLNNPQAGDLDIIPLAPSEAIPLWISMKHVTGAVSPISLIDPRLGTRVFF